MLEKIYKNKFILLAILGVFVWWKKGKMGYVQFDKAIFFAGIIFIIIILFENLEKAWKYESPQFVCANLHGSTNMVITPVDEYALVKKGGILTDWVMEGTDGTFIIPLNSLFCGKNVIISSILVEETDLYALPPPVFTFIKNRPDFKPPFFYGEFPLFTWENWRIELTELKEKINALHRMFNWLQEQHKIATQEVDNYISHIRRITKEDSYWKLFEKRDTNE